MNDVSNNVDSFDDENVAKDVDIVFIAFDVERNVDIDADIAVDVISANSLIVILTSSLDVDDAENVDFAIDAMNVRSAITFDVIKLDDANTANSFATDFSLF